MKSLRISLQIVFICVCLVQFHWAQSVVHHSLEDARSERQRLVQKYIKTLNKEEGAIRLVGGDAEYEGMKGYDTVVI